ncbi:MAG: hypothetical protein K0R54_1838 [Clostridiaceae bacterium]|jgi:hypothetical protein|nr:hypothetical protein [Clostridiaceae bacterium]
MAKIKGFESLDILLGMEKEVKVIRDKREAKKEKRRKEREDALKNQSYRMINSSINDVVPNFIATIDNCKDMDEAVNYFKNKYKVEFPGCNIIQTAGINPKYRANFLLNSVETTEKERNAFLLKYGSVPERWVLHDEILKKLRLSYAS